MNTPAAAPTPDHWTPPRKGVVQTVFIVLIVLIALLSIARAWGWLPLLTGETTEDAYVRGRTTVIAPQVSGYAGSEFAVLNPDNANGNFVKVPQRTGVRIAVDGPSDVAAPLRPGMSAVASVDTRMQR